MALSHKQFVRCLSLSAKLMRKPNIQRPLVPSTERRLLDAVTVPIFPADLRPLPVKCFDEMRERQEQKKSELSEAYKEFRLNQAMKVFNDNKMVAICHCLPMAPRDNLAIRTKLNATGMKLVSIRNDVAIKATENSKFHHLRPFLTSTNVYIVSEEPKLVELVTVLKKISELHLLGLVVEDRILSRDAAMKAASLPPLDTLRGELLTILKSSASRTHSLLGSHQQELSRCLGQLSTTTDAPSPPSSSSPSSTPSEENV